MKLRPAEMELMQRMVRQLCGVTLDDQKDYLVETRLSGLARKYGCENFNEFYFRLRYGMDPDFVDDVVDAITTHETTWFRDGAPFDALQDGVLRELADARARAGAARTLRVWSAACSTGQEPYSLAMVLREALPDVERWDIEIVATDISKPTLEKAQQALFLDHEMSRTTRPNLMRKYFAREDGGYRVVEAVRRMVSFRQLNLLRPWRGMGPFDLVFLRNVLFYFDPQNRLDVAERVADSMQPHGLLVLGASESLREGGPRFVPERRGGAVFYRAQRLPQAK